MQIKVRLSNLRTAPRKVRLVADLVRGKRVAEAQSILLFTTNKSARPVLKLLNSAIATAKNDLHLDDSNLFISAITVDEGPKLKRWHPMSRGRAFPIIKRSAHVMLTLNELNSVNIKPARIAKQNVAGGEKSVKKTIKKAIKPKAKVKKS
ncbi:MAG: 50S ribosomal protein L22, partial [Candidatus Staskawiczbacteria bacterium]|nr:50S ribosomal protein L22 [Candidatus Staskawiczbacteria bacterium]